MATVLWDEGTAAAYDATTAEMFTPERIEPVVDALERLARGGRALELAIGTGRIALPCAPAAWRCTASSSHRTWRRNSPPSGAASSSR